MYPLTTFAFISFTLVSPPEPPLETTDPFSVHVPFETLIQDNVFSSHVLCSFVESNVLSPVNYLCPLLKISCFIYINICIYDSISRLCYIPMISLSSLHQCHTILIIVVYISVEVRWYQLSKFVLLFFFTVHFHFRLCWVFVAACGLSLVVANRVSSLQSLGFPLQGLLIVVASLVVGYSSGSTQAQ